MMKKTVALCNLHANNIMLIKRIPGSSTVSLFASKAEGLKFESIVFLRKNQKQILQKPKAHMAPVK